MINAWSMSDLLIYLYNYDKTIQNPYMRMSTTGKIQKISLTFWECSTSGANVCAKSLLSHVRKKTPLREKVLWAIVKTASPTNDSIGLGLLECSTEPFEAKSHTASDPYHQNMLNQMCNLIYRNWNLFWPFLCVYYSIVYKIPRPAWRARKEMIINAPHCHSKTLNTPSSHI